MHPIIGAKILEGSNIGIIRMGKGIALTHHERWDGKGYPNGLKETQIALPGRVVALADVFDALTTERPYKEAFSIEKSLQIISEESGKQFDPAVVAAFFTVIDEILEIKAEFKDEGLSLLYDMDRKVHGNNKGVSAPLYDLTNKKKYHLALPPMGQSPKKLSKPY